MARGDGREHETGDPVRVTGAPNLMEAEMIVELLRDNEIPALIRRMRGFDVPDFLAGGPRDVCVMPAEFDRARALIESHFGLDRPFGQ